LGAKLRIKKEKMDKKEEKNAQYAQLLLYYSYLCQQYG